MKGMTEDEMVGGIINSMDVSWRILWEIVRDWEQDEKEMTEDEMAKWHHQLDVCEFE